MNPTVRTRLLLLLVGLYPRWWQHRYRAEFTEMIMALVADRRRPTVVLALDIVVGALDARISRSPDMPRFPADAALRRGFYDGLIVTAVIAVVVVLTNVVFPPGPNESDGDPEYVVGILGVYLTIGLLLAVIGAHGQFGANTPFGGAKAGAAAGSVIGAGVFVSFLAVNNLFFGTISQQHDKIAAFAASGWTSMRAFVNVNLLMGAPFFIVALTIAGAALGFLGGSFGRLRTTRWPTPGAPGLPEGPPAGTARTG